MSEDFPKRHKKRRSSILKSCTDQNVIRSETTISRRVSFSRSKNVQEYIVGNPPVESTYVESYFDEVSSLRHTEDEDSRALSMPSPIESSLCDKSVFTHSSDEPDLDITKKLMIEAASDGFPFDGNEDFMDNIEDLISQEAEKSFAILDTSHDKNEGTRWIPSNKMESSGMDMTIFTSETQEEYSNKENRDVRSRHVKMSTNRTLRESMGMDLTIVANDQLNTTTQKNKTIRESMGMDFTVVDHRDDSIEDCEEEEPIRNKTLKESVGMELTMRTESNSPVDEDLSFDTNPMKNPPWRNKTHRESIGMNFTLGADNNTYGDDNPNVFHKSSQRNKTLREPIGMDMTMGVENNSLADEDMNLLQKQSLKDRTLRESVGMNMTLETGSNFYAKKDIKSKTEFVHKQSKNDVTMSVENEPLVREDIKLNPNLNHKSLQSNKTTRESIGMNFTLGADNNTYGDDNPNVFHKSSQRNKTLREPIGMDMTMGVENNSLTDEDVNFNSNLIQKQSLKDRTLRESVGMNMTLETGSNFYVKKDIKSKTEFVHKQSQNDVTMNVRNEPLVRGDVNSNPNLNHKSSKNNKTHSMKIGVENHAVVEDTDSISNLIHKQPQSDKTIRESIGMNLTMGADGNSSVEEDMDNFPAKIHNPSKRNKTVRESVGMDFTITSRGDSSTEPQFKNTSKKWKGQSEYLNLGTQETKSIDVPNESSLRQINEKPYNRLVESEKEEMNLTDSAPNKEKTEMSLNKSESIKKSMNSEVYIDPHQSCQSTNSKSEENEINIEDTFLKSKHNALKTMLSSEMRTEEEKMMEAEVHSGVSFVETTEESKKAKNGQIHSMNKWEKLNIDDCLSESQIKKRKVVIDEECHSVQNIIADDVSSSNFDSQTPTKDSNKNERSVSNPGQSINGNRLIESQEMEHENSLKMKKVRTENGFQGDIADSNSKVDDDSRPKREFCDSKELKLDKKTGNSSRIPIPILNNPESETLNIQKPKLAKSGQNSESLFSAKEINLTEAQNTSMNDTQESNWISQVETPPCNKLSGLYSVNSAESSFSDTYNSFRIQSSVENTPQSKEFNSTMETISVFRYYEKEQLNFNDDYKYAEYSITSLSDDAALLSFMQGKFILTFDIEPLDFVEDKEDCSVSHWTVKKIRSQITYTKSDPFVNLVLDLLDEAFHQKRMLTDACSTTMSFKDFLGHIRPQISNACMMIINEIKIFHSHPCSGLDSKNPRIYLIHFSGFCFNFNVEVNFEKGLDFVRESVSCTASEGPVNVNFILNLASKSKRSWMFFKDYIRNVDLYVKHMDIMYLKSLGLEF